jgi:hypothetical protein
LLNPNHTQLDLHRKSPTTKHGLLKSSSLLDHRGCRFRVDRTVATEKQQHHPAGLPDSSPAQGKKALIRIGKPALEQKIRGKVDAEIDKWHINPPTKTALPTIVEHPIDTELQTGESQKLGGPMSIHAPWRRD